jgi:hypothetical protein
MRVLISCLSFASVVGAFLKLLIRSSNSLQDAMARPATTMMPAEMLNGSAM